MDLPLEIAEIATRLAPVFHKYNVRKAVLFGSYCKGTATSNSDIDLLVDSGLRGMAYIGLLATVQELFKQEIDMIDTTHLIPGSLLALEIQEHGIIVYPQA